MFYNLFVQGLKRLNKNEPIGNPEQFININLTTESDK